MTMVALIESVTFSFVGVNTGSAVGFGRSGVAV